METQDHNPQPLDLDKEYGNNTQQVPSFLMVLLVLTAINVVYNLYKTIRELFISAPTTANIEASFYQSLEDSGVEMSEMPEWIMTGFMQFMEKYVANAVTIRAVDLGYYLMLGVAAFMMYRLRLTGFYLYIAVNVLGVIIVPVLYGFNFIALSMAIMYAIAAVLFIALYGANRKHFR